MISLSVVLYNTSKEDVANILKSLEYVKSHYTLYIIDNSLEDNLKKYFINHNKIIYIHNPSNPGFGASHNIVLKKAINNEFDYHFVINPDVFFYEDVITYMVEYMEENLEVGMMMPQILNLDGTSQNLPKLLPTPFSILLRKFKQPKFLYNPFIEKYELRNIEKDKIYNAPILSGCFTVFRVKYLKEIGLYDDRFFMYFEDWDISRRMHKKYKTMYYPKVSVFHGYESGANKNKHLFKIFIKSAQRYFNKWGWFIDRDRSFINQHTLAQFK